MTERHASNRRVASYERYNKRQKRKQTLAFIGGFVICYILWFIYHKQHTHKIGVGAITLLTRVKSLMSDKNWQKLSQEFPGIINSLEFIEF